MPKAILPYSEEKIQQVREWVVDCESWLEARKIISDRLGIHPDNATRMNRKHRFWPTDGNAPVEYEPRAPRVLYLDLETSPNVVLSWRIGRKINLDASNILKERAIICACWSWDNNDRVYSATWDKNQDDKTVVEKLMPVIDEADVIIMQNGDRFDLPWFRTRCLIHGLVPKANYRTIDTLKVLRSKFYFNSNRLDYVAKTLGLGGKIKTEFGLWKDVVLDKCPTALASMVEYCCHDIVLLKQIWHRLEFTVKPKLHVGVLGGGDKWSCPYCGSEDVEFVKTFVTASGTVQYDMRCRECGAVYTISGKAYEGWKLRNS